MRLTDRYIASLRFEGQQRKLFDDALPNFGVRVYQSGVSFIVMIGTERRMKTLGRYPEMTLKEARREAFKILDWKSPTSTPKTPEKAIMGFLEHCERRNKPRTVKDYQRLLKRFPDTFDRQDILSTFHTFRNTPGELAHITSAFQIFLNWCVNNGIIEHNPIAGLKNQGKINKRERILTDDELIHIWNNATHHTFGPIIKLLITTGQRRSEIGNIEWNFIHHDHITFPTGYTKNKKEHTFPIGVLTNEILQSLTKTEALVFTFNGWAKCKRQLESELPHWTLHDLRRTFASNHARLGTPIHIIERLLNHSPAGVHWVYNRHTYTDELRLACETYENWLQSLLLRA